MFEVKVCGFDDLTKPEQENMPNNGSGKKWASYLVVQFDSRREVYSSAMEPEDVSFYRDLNWMPELLKAVYEHGKSEASNE